MPVSRRHFLTAAAASFYVGSAPLVATQIRESQSRDGITQASATELARAIRDFARRVRYRLIPWLY